MIQSSNHPLVLTVTDVACRDMLDPHRFAHALMTALPKIEKKSSSLSLASSDVLRQKKLKLHDGRLKVHREPFPESKQVRMNGYPILTGLLQILKSIIHVHIVFIPRLSSLIRIYLSNWLLATGPLRTLPNSGIHLSLHLIILWTSSMKHFPWNSLCHPFQVCLFGGYWILQNVFCACLWWSVKLSNTDPMILQGRGSMSTLQRATCLPLLWVYLRFPGQM